MFLLRILFQFESRIRILPFRVVSPSQLEPWGFDFSNFLHGEFKPCVKQRMMSFCSMQNLHWNTVHILFSLLRWLLCKVCKIFLQKYCLFWAFQQNYWLFLEDTFLVPEEIWGRMVDYTVCKWAVHPFNLSLYSKVASSTILGNNLPIVQWNVSNKLMPLSRGTHLAQSTHTTVANSYIILCN